MAGTAEVAVVGGGILGAAAALLCARHGLAVDWYAPPEDPQRSDGAAHRAYTLAPRSQTLLASLGVWPSLEPQTQPVHAMHLRLCEPPPGASWQLASSSPQPLARTCLHHALLSALEAAAAHQPTLRRRGAWHPSPRPGHAQAELPPARLVLAADGAQSPTRRAAGILWSRHDYGQKAVVAAFATENPHEGRAFQWFEADGRVLALLPMAHPHQVSLVYSMGNDAAARFVDLDPVARAQALPQDSPLGALSPRLESTGEHRATMAPLAMGTAERLHLGRLLLLGDAGHTVHPLAGYGLNLGFDDLAELAQAMAPQITRDHHLRDPQAIAAGVAQRRRRALATAQWGLHGIHRAMAAAGSAPWVGKSLQLGIGMLSRSPWAQRMLVQAAQDGGLPFLPAPAASVATDPTASIVRPSP